MTVEPTEPSDPDDSASGSEVGGGPKIVVTAIDLNRSAREALAQRMGPGHVIVDIRDAGNQADIVLIPPASGQLVGAMRGMFPGAQLLITEFTDVEYGGRFPGPVSRSIDSGVDGYFVAPSMDELAAFTHRASTQRTIAGELTGGPGGGRRTYPLTLDVHQTDNRAPSELAEIRLDLADWCQQTGLDADTAIGLAWPLLLQLRRQNLRVTVAGIESGDWLDRAAAAGIDAE